MIILLKMKIIINYFLLTNKKQVKCKKDQLSISNFSANKQCQVYSKNILQTNKLIKSDNVKSFDLSPVIPLSVLHYLD